MRFPAEIPVYRNTAIDVLLICEFGTYLSFRILDVYRSFRRLPRIIVARRGPTSMPGRGPISMPEIPGLPLHMEVIPLPMPAMVSMGPITMTLALPATLAYLTYSFLLFLKILRRRDIKIKLVHAHFIFPQGFFGLLLSRLLRVPLIVTAAGRDVNVMMSKNALLRALCRPVSEAAHLTIAVSQPIQRQLVRLGVDRTIYLPNSVDTALIHPVEEAHGEGILFISHLIERKRPLLLVNAFARIAGQIPNAKLMMCGDGPLRAAVLKEVRKLSLESRIELIRGISAEGLNALLAWAAVFVLPSESEGLSLSLLEAMAAGKTVVVSKNESNASVLTHKENALLFDVDDVADLSRKLLMALTNRTLRRRIGRSARALCVEHFSNAVVGKQLESVYLKATGL